MKENKVNRRWNSRLNKSENINEEIIQSLAERKGDIITWIRGERYVRYMEMVQNWYH